MIYQPDDKTADKLKSYYQTSTRYRDDLETHNERFLDPFVQLVQRYVQPQSAVLDLGCGTGLSTTLLGEADYQTFGLDLSPLFLKVEKERSPKTDLMAADALRLPFADASFDAVVAFEFIEHVPDIPSLLDEMLRVLRYPGHIVIHSPNLLSPYLPAFDLMRMALGKEGRPVFAENVPQACRWLKCNLLLSLRKKLSRNPHFLYRQPDLSEREIGGDSDSVYLANQMDLARYFKHKNCVVDQLAHAMSLKNKVLAAMTPSIAPYIGFVAHKLKQ